MDILSKNMLRMVMLKWGIFLHVLKHHIQGLLCVYELTRFSETIGSQLFHGAEIRTEPLPLLVVAKRVDHPGAHAAKKKDISSYCIHIFPCRVHKNRYNEHPLTISNCFHHSVILWSSEQPNHSSFHHT